MFEYDNPLTHAAQAIVEGRRAADQAQLSRQQLAMGQLQLDEAQRKAQDAKDLRAELAGLQGTPAKTVVNGGFTPAPTEDFTVSNRMMLGGARDETPAKTRANEATYGIVSPTTDTSIAPKELQYTPAPAFNPVASQAPAIDANIGKPTVTTIPAIPATDADRIKAAINFHMTHGNMNEANALKKQVMEEAQQLIALSGNPNDGLALMNKALGMDLKSQKVGKFDFIKDSDGNTTGIFMEDEARRRIAAGEDPKAAVDASTVHMGDSGSAGQKLAAFIATKKGDVGFKEALSFLGENNLSISGKGVSAILESLRKDDNVAQTDFGTFKNGYLQEHPGANDADVSRAWDARKIAQANASRQVIVNNPLPAKVNVNQLEPEEQTAISRAIASGKLDPYKVNSRNQKMLAQVLITNPDADINAISAQLGVARNKDVVMKAGVAEMLPTLIQKTAEAGKALNYSDAKFLGSIEKWKNGQLNDPKLTRYMTLRNDQLLTIGSVVRGNGMTDMAQKLEEEAMHPTLSPKALDQWVEGQLESIDPRLNFYRKLTAGNKGIPRSNYRPGTGAAGLDANQPSTNAPKQVISYFKTAVSSGAGQKRMIRELRSKGWSAQQIGAAWAAYQRGQ